MKVTLLAITFTLFTAGISAQNMVPNGDWEMGPDSSSDPFNGWLSHGPDNWTPIATPDRIFFGDFAQSRDGHAAQSGDAYCIFYGPTPEGGWCILNTSLDSGTTYYLYYYLDVDDNFDNGPGAINFNFVGANSFNSPFVTNTGSWQYFDTSFVASGNADTLQIYGAGDNLIKIDSIYLTDTPPSGGSGIFSHRQSTETISIFPNPAKNMFTVRATHSGQFTLIDLSGRQVATGWLNRHFDARNLPAGMYFIHSPAGTGKLVLK